MATAGAKATLRSATALDFDPFVLDAGTVALIDRRVLAAPLLVTWSYRVMRPVSYQDWLARREIVLAEARLGRDPAVGGVRYLGTWRVAGTAADWETTWGYASHAAMTEMQRVCGLPRPPLTIIQGDLADFVAGVSQYLAEAGTQYFTQRVLVAGATLKV